MAFDLDGFRNRIRQHIQQGGQTVGPLPAELKGDPKAIAKVMTDSQKLQADERTKAQQNELKAEEAKARHAREDDGVSITFKGPMSNLHQIVQGFGGSSAGGTALPSVGPEGNYGQSGQVYLPEPDLQLDVPLPGIPAGGASVPPGVMGQQFGPGEARGEAAAAPPVQRQADAGQGDRAGISFSQPYTTDRRLEGEARLQELMGQRTDIPTREEAGFHSQSPPWWRQMAAGFVMGAPNAMKYFDEQREKAYQDYVQPMATAESRRKEDVDMAYKMLPPDEQMVDVTIDLPGAGPTVLPVSARATTFLTGLVGQFNTFNNQQKLSVSASELPADIRDRVVSRIGLPSNLKIPLDVWADLINAVTLMEERGAPSTMDALHARNLDKYGPEDPRTKAAEAALEHKWKIQYADRSMSGTELLLAAEDIGHPQHAIAKRVVEGQTEATVLKKMPAPEAWNMRNDSVLQAWLKSDPADAGSNRGRAIMNQLWSNLGHGEFDPYESKLAEWVQDNPDNPAVLGLVGNGRAMHTINAGRDPVERQAYRRVINREGYHFLIPRTVTQQGAEPLLDVKPGKIVPPDPNAPEWTVFQEVKSQLFQKVRDETEWADKQKAKYPTGNTARLNALQSELDRLEKAQRANRGRRATQSVGRIESLRQQIADINELTRGGEGAFGAPDFSLFTARKAAQHLMTWFPVQADTDPQVRSALGQPEAPSATRQGTAAPPSPSPEAPSPAGQNDDPAGLRSLIP